MEVDSIACSRGFVEISVDWRFYQAAIVIYKGSISAAVATACNVAHARTVHLRLHPETI